MQAPDQCFTYFLFVSTLILKTHQTKQNIDALANKPYALPTLAVKQWITFKSTDV